MHVPLFLIAVLVLSSFFTAVQTALISTHGLIKTKRLIFTLSWHAQRELLWERVTQCRLRFLVKKKVLPHVLTYGFTQKKKKKDVYSFGMQRENRE